MKKLLKTHFRFVLHTWKQKIEVVKMKRSTEDEQLVINLFSSIKAIQKSDANFPRLWFMLEGASSHCINRVLRWQSAKFQDRIIRRNTTVLWPPQSPDLNPIDFYLWGFLAASVFKIPNQSIHYINNYINTCKTIFGITGIISLLRIFVRIAFKWFREFLERCIEHVAQVGQVPCDFEHLKIVKVFDRSPLIINEITETVR